jgi:hypothetical protein
MTGAARYKIHPAIGVARVGNAPESAFFLGPEIPNEPSTGSGDAGTVVPPFKSAGLIKRQAARFRVWEYLDIDGVWTPSREVTGLDADVVDLTWKVHLANRKASFFAFAGPPDPTRNVESPVRRNPGEDPRTLDIDPLARTIAGRSAAPVDLSRGSSPTPEAESWPGSPEPIPAIESLGQLRTDRVGRLIVIPAAGIAAGRPKAVIDDYANNNGWFDDVSDGPITATLRLRSADGHVVDHDVDGAWLLVGPPDFAPPLPQVVTLYDVLVDLAVRRLSLPTDEALYRHGSLSRLPAMAADLADGGTALPTCVVDFDSDVAPILRAAVMATAVYAPLPPHRFHRSLGNGDLDAWAALSDPAVDTGVRATVVGRLRKPGTTSATKDDGEPFIDGLMPRLLGDDPYGEGQRRRGLTLTMTQYAIMQRWAAGAFIGSRLEPSSLLNPPTATEITPHGLDEAALRNASGGAFYPGIEVSWLIREPALYAAPFRIRHGAPSCYACDDPTVTVGAGYFSRQMALPWLADFRDCKSEDHPPGNDPRAHRVFGWWPSQRPDRVYPNGAAAADAGPMVLWHRASVAGAAASWPPDPAASPPRLEPSDTPTFGQMIANWWRFGFVAKVAEGYAETERAETIPDQREQES